MRQKKIPDAKAKAVPATAVIGPALGENRCRDHSQRHATVLTVGVALLFVVVLGGPPD
ncbi:hypothetical protein ACFYY2_10225 [Streptomyces sp. NPDC001822]|uniref:hypothetical protein n=1 Tax=Streptomyces sp. NPDC001822 TaxID=3364614 RepID=UPI0036B3ACDF